MQVGIISVYMDYRRTGQKRRGVLQPGVGPIIAGLLPADVDVHLVNETWEDPDWNRHYDLLFISSMHSDFDRARQISRYWQRRGAKTVFGGIMASTYPHLCEPYFDAVVIGDAEGAVPELFRDFRDGRLQRRYVAKPYDPERTPTPRFDLVAGKHLVPITFEATRGCPFSCDFCALTGIGTRYHTRPPEAVVRDVRHGQRVLKGKVPELQRRFIGFLDNNIGGNPTHLAALCAALEKLGVRWGAAITFNALARPGTIQQLVRAGCRVVFVGLESFNEAAITDMRKFQNAIAQIQTVLDRCLRAGLLVEAGLMLSPLIDDRAYIRSIPRKLAEVGLFLPTFISFECPIPGTPHFRRLAAEPEGALLANGFLRDYTGYTLVVQPKRQSAGEMIEEFQWVSRQVYRTSVKLRKFAHNLPELAARGHWVTIASDIAAHFGVDSGLGVRRTYLAGTDTPPPEASSVPLTNGDFDSEEDRRALCEPWRVTDDRGRVLPIWLQPIKVFEARGRLSESARQLIAV